MWQLIKPALCVLMLVGALCAHGQEESFDYSALKEPPAETPKALKAAMLAVALAGNRLVGVGERGFILISDDGGMNWRQAKSPVSVSLTGVQFVTPTKGWVIGHMGVVLHTEDGGETWVKQLDGIEAAEHALDSAKAESPVDAARLEEAERLVEEGPDKPFLAIHFDNSSNGYVLGAFGLAMKTSDGGQTWTAWDAHIENPRGMHPYAIRRVGGALIVVGEQGLLLRSIDNGESFSPLPSPYDGSFFGLVVGKAGEIIAYGLRGSVYRSSDQGDSWTQIETGLEVSIGAGTCLDDGTLVLRSYAGDLLVSRDGGQSFDIAQSEKKVPAAGLVAFGNTLVVASLRGLFNAEIKSNGRP